MVPTCFFNLNSELEFPNKKHASQFNINIYLLIYLNVHLLTLCYRNTYVPLMDILVLYNIFYYVITSPHYNSILHTPPTLYCMIYTVWILSAIKNIDFHIHVRVPIIEEFYIITMHIINYATIKQFIFTDIYYSFLHSYMNYIYRKPIMDNNIYYIHVYMGVHSKYTITIIISTLISNTSIGSTYYMYMFGCHSFILVIHVLLIYLMGLLLLLLLLVLLLHVCLLVLSVRLFVIYDCKLCITLTHLSDNSESHSIIKVRLDLIVGMLIFAVQAYMLRTIIKCTHNHGNE